jgi:hypothetical protein
MRRGAADGNPVTAAANARVAQVRLFGLERGVCGQVGGSGGGLDRGDRSAAGSRRAAPGVWRDKTMGCAPKWRILASLSRPKSAVKSARWRKNIATQRLTDTAHPVA